MAGTKMTLHRYGGRVNDWEEETIIIDQGYKDVNGDSLLVVLKNAYELGYDLLEVYLNGHRLINGIEYLEIDPNTIQLDLGKFEDGTPVVLSVGDELFIKTWKNHYYTRGDIPKSTDINKILKSIEEIINYGGANDVERSYEHDDQGRIIREVTTGDYNIIREFTYNELDEYATEKIFYDNKTILKTNTYDLSNGRLIKSSVKVLQ